MLSVSYNAPGRYNGRVYFCLYNSEAELIETRAANEKGRAQFEIDKTGEYVLCAKSSNLSPKSIYSRIFLCAEKDNYAAFVFNKIKPPAMSDVSFSLTDKNYSGYPISRGVINLWHR